MISIIHPTRSRPEKSVETVDKWIDLSSNYANIQLIVSLDEDDPKLDEYKQAYDSLAYIINRNRSCVDAINNAAKKANGDILIVVSDDTDCFVDWDLYILKVSEGMGNDWILKTQDGIQPWIITAPIMDRAYYNRFGYIYHPDFEHMFCDTYMTAVADITGRKITSNLEFKHLNNTINDDLRNRTNGTWAQGEATFIRLMREFTPEERNRITDRSMKNWLRNHGVR
jgi:glycosyltransferase involved in cell wall biosynthesis